ncbi:GltB/FmdC/FwdC-like GXGXG domain-containing protein [Intestinibacillus massiliensis]|uniref:GltB/FmdC/FwdC-like GXGXG domain-containing protein n=1 Tax=Intestinibacillus massiliensis TaxID=1871029 RepID=UPI000B34D30D|nr:glutamate synthase [Intestinibacillus massiliensis]
MVIQANLTHFKTLNEQIRACPDADITVGCCTGQRYIASGMSGRRITVHGTPGNALGAYLDGCTIEVFGNAQDATGDTMNSGEIIIHGSCGDATGYGMRGGRILVEGDCGYRGGIHMKAYEGQLPVLVIGGQAGSFLGEYLAGGLIIVLGRGVGGLPPVSYFCGTGMHGGKIVLRCDEAPQGLPRQVLVSEATAADRAELLPHLEAYCRRFGGDAQALAAERYFVLTPNPEAGYKQLYTFN